MLRRYDVCDDCNTSKRLQLSIIMKLTVRRDQQCHRTCRMASACSGARGENWCGVSQLICIRRNKVSNINLAKDVKFFIHFILCSVLCDIENSKQNLQRQAQQVELEHCSLHSWSEADYTAAQLRPRIDFGFFTSLTWTLSVKTWRYGGRTLRLKDAWMIDRPAYVALKTAPCRQQY